LARYRLRFVLQEFDLPRGTTTIGRSVECQLTLDDPLVSRRHARIVVEDEAVHLEDLGSRNGVRVNGSIIKSATPLRSGDRIRIGTQEVIFTRVDTVGTPFRITGSLRLCANCRTPYPKEMVACPGCGATEQTDDDMPTDAGAEGSTWSVQLLVEALERALRLGRAGDAEALMRRAAVQVDEMVGAGRRLDPEAFATLAQRAFSTALAAGDSAWAVWAVGIFGRAELVPPVAVVDALGEVARKHPRALRAAIEDLLLRAGQVAAHPPAELESLSRLDTLRVSLDGDDEVTGNLAQS
jgi:hypothetical protein